MSIHLADSQVYGHLWATDEARDLLGEESRFSSWLSILATLAEAQAQLGLIPKDAASEIRALAEVGEIDMDLVAAETRECGHSTLGLIRALRRSLPEHAAEWVYYGSTVQDLSDTWTSLVMRDVGAALDRDLEELEKSLLSLARDHRDTPMLGRTHAQPGLPITFGFKAAVWVSEVRRHRERLADGRGRWEVAQLGGALGTMEFWGDQALDLLGEFADRLGLRAPTIPWITSRDSVAEFANLLAMISSTMAKIGNEIMELQRPEIGEIREGFVGGTVGSITMPHKRNPEISEHLDTLARVVRADAAIVTEGIVHLHERDGRAWKAEWVAIPEACSFTLTSTALARRLIDGLVVDVERMTANIEAQRGYVFSEPVMRGLAQTVGKHVAQEIVYSAAMGGIERGESLIEALSADPRVMDALDEGQVGAMFDLRKTLGSAPSFVDRVIKRMKSED